MRSLTLPDWYRCGGEVSDIFQESPDAGFIFDEGEIVDGIEVTWSLLRWRRCIIPVEEFGYRYADLSAHLDRLCGRGLVNMQDERDRAANIARWMRARGGPAKALAESPVLVTVRPERGLVVEDGFHRIGVASHLFGCSMVQAMCAPLLEVAF